MGNSKSSQKDFNATQWTKLYSAGNSDVLVSKQNPNFKIMEHTFKAASQPEFKKAEKEKTDFEEAVSKKKNFNK